MNATDILRNEHETILDVLDALDSIRRSCAKSGTLDVDSAREALGFLRTFADGCHHGKEERLLFPAIAAHGMPREVGPLYVMTNDHDEGRRLLSRMEGALDDFKLSPTTCSATFASAAMAYVELMREHIAKENGVLFPMGDEMLSDAEQAQLIEQFETFEHTKVEAGAHCGMLDVAARLCARLGVSRAARPASHAHGCCGHSAPRK